jgi:hypothetical protein
MVDPVVGALHALFIFASFIMTQDKLMLPCRNVVTVLFFVFTVIACDKKTSADQSAHNTDPSRPLPEIPQDSGMYIGFATRLNQNEFYVDLYLKDSVEVNDDINEFLQGSTDSIIYQDDEIKRSLLPGSIAEEYFDMTGLQRLDLFDSLGNAVGSADLQQVEFYEDLIETRIIAVYRSDVASKVSYVIGGDTPGDRVDGFSPRLINDSGFDKAMITKIESLADPATRLTMIHWKIEPDGDIYSFGSDYQSSYIFDHQRSEVLYARADMTFLHVLPIHKQRNNRPVFLAAVGQPETDLIWTMLLLFDGKEYSSTVHQRLNKPVDK